MELVLLETMMGEDEKKLEESPDQAGQMRVREDDLSESDLGLFNLFFLLF